MSTITICSSLHSSTPTGQSECCPLSPVTVDWSLYLLQSASGRYWCNWEQRWRWIWEIQDWYEGDHACGRPSGWIFGDHCFFSSHGRPGLLLWFILGPSWPCLVRAKEYLRNRGRDRVIIVDMKNYCQYAILYMPQLGICEQCQCRQMKQKWSLHVRVSYFVDSSKQTKVPSNWMQRSWIEWLMCDLSGVESDSFDLECTPWTAFVWSINAPYVQYCISQILHINIHHLHLSSAVLFKLGKVHVARDQERTKVVVQVCHGRRRNNGPHISIRTNNHKRDLLHINPKSLIPVSTFAPSYISIIQKHSVIGTWISLPCQRQENNTRFDQWGQKNAGMSK